MGDETTRQEQGHQQDGHDAVFRFVLGVAVNAASQLRAVLPGGLAGRLDLGKLRRVNGSFVDEELKWRHSDVLFTAPLQGRPAFVYVLIEHQSGPDPLMAFRVLRYMVRIWDQYVLEHPRAARLPAVIPLVVHSGRRRWTNPVQLADLFDLDPEAAEMLGEHLPRFAFLLDDLARVDEPALRARPLTEQARVTLLLLKTAPGNSGLLADLRRWADDLTAILEMPGGGRVFTALMRYILLVSETADSQLHQLSAELGPRAEEAYVTAADTLRAEGEARGRAEGEARGAARGRAEALMQLLTLKFGALPQNALDAVQAAPAGQLETWTGRVLTAATLEDVLR